MSLLLHLIACFLYTLSALYAEAYLLGQQLGRIPIVSTR